VTLGEQANFKNKLSFINTNNALLLS